MECTSQRRALRLPDGLWQQILASVPVAKPYYRCMTHRRDEPVVSVLKFGLASSACHRIVSRDEAIAAKAARAARREAPGGRAEEAQATGQGPQGRAARRGR